MASGKVKNPVSVTRAQKLPPIREETFRDGTPRERTIHYEVRPKTLDPDQNKPQVHVRPLPAQRKNEQRYVSPRNSSKFETDPKPLIPVYNKPLSPVDTTHTLVDGVVADYLHYAKYGHVIPIYEGTGSLSCPCCTDRNRENVRTLLGFPSSQADGKSETGRSPRENNTGSQTNIRSDVRPEVRSNQRSYNNLPSWLYTQPLPYASNYLNPEFNRPAVLHNYKVEHQNDSEKNFINSQVLAASQQYDEAMKKLEQFGN